MMNTLHIQTDSATPITDLIFISLFAVSRNGLSLGSDPRRQLRFWERVCLHSRCVWSVWVCVCISPYDYPLYAVGRSGIESRSA